MLMYFDKLLKIYANFIAELCGSMANEKIDKD